MCVCIPEGEFGPSCRGLEAMATPLASSASLSLLATVAVQQVPSPGSKQLAVSQISSGARVGFARARSDRLFVAAVGGSPSPGPVSAEEKASSSSEDVVSATDYDFRRFFVYVLVSWLWLWRFWDCVLNFYRVSEGVAWRTALWMFPHFSLVIRKLNLGVPTECLVFY